MLCITARIGVAIALFAAAAGSLQIPGNWSREVGMAPRFRPNGSLAEFGVSCPLVRTHLS